MFTNLSFIWPYNALSAEVHPEGSRPVGRLPGHYEAVGQLVKHRHFISFVLREANEKRKLTQSPDFSSYSRRRQ